MKLSFEPVDRILAATGESHFYRAFQVDEGWIVYVHGFDAAAGERPLMYTASTLERAQVFAQAFENGDAEKNVSKRIAQATQAACGITRKG
jgi:hypothetical protein